MNGKTYGNEGYIIIDYIDVDVALESIRELADVLVAYPDTSSGAPTATAAFMMYPFFAPAGNDTRFGG